MKYKVVIAPADDTQELNIQGGRIVAVIDTWEDDGHTLMKILVESIEPTLSLATAMHR